MLLFRIAPAENRHPLFGAMFLSFASRSLKTGIHFSARCCRLPRGEQPDMQAAMAAKNAGTDKSRATGDMKGKNNGRYQPRLEILKLHRPLRGRSKLATS